MASTRATGRAWGFFSRTLTWLFGLVAVVGIARLLALGLQTDHGAAGGGVHLLVAWIGMFLPYAAFAGGLSVSATVPARVALKKSLLITFISFSVLAYAEPLARYHDKEGRGVEVSTQFPFGPETPGGLLALRTEIQRKAGNHQSHSVDQPLLWPLNWVTYLLHCLVVIPLFAPFAGLLGQRTSDLTSGLSPPNRRNARWGLGLISGAVFFLASAFSGDWVRLDPTHSGVIGAWAPLLIPLLELSILTWLCNWKGPRRIRVEGGGVG
jgi:hypothetical protein